MWLTDYLPHTRGIVCQCQLVQLHTNMSSFLYEYFNKEQSPGSRYFNVNTLIIESVDSISRDDPDMPYM